MISQYLAIGKLFALLGAVALICFQSSQIHKWHLHSEALSAKLEAISTERDTQRKVTSGNIKAAEDKVKAVQPVKERIIKAPNPSNCSSPALEEMRNAL
jgi:hypothetical protein